MVQTEPIDLGSMGSPRDLYADRNTPCMGHLNLLPRPRSEPVSRRLGTFDPRLIVRTKHRISGKRHDLLKEARIDNSERSNTLNAIPERVRLIRVTPQLSLKIKARSVREDVCAGRPPEPGKRLAFAAP